MDYGIVLPGGGMTMAEMVAIACRAEELGLASVHCVEAWRDALVPLAAIATATSSIEIGPYILNAYARTPWLAGMSSIDLDELCDGRLQLCIGMGNRHINEAYQGTPVDRPAAKLEEYVRLLRMVISARPGDLVDFEGEFHRMRGWPPAVAPLRPSIPIHLAAVFPSMRRAAGRVADGVALGVLCSPGYISGSITPDVRSAAAEAGRDPRAIATIAAALVAVDDDVRSARDTIRRAICSLFAPLPHPYYAFVMREQGYGSVVAEIVARVAEGSLERAVAAVPGELVEELAVAGPADYCRQRLAAFSAVADRLLLVNAGSTTGASGLASVVEAYDSVMRCCA